MNQSSVKMLLLLQFTRFAAKTHAWSVSRAPVVTSTRLYSSSSVNNVGISRKSTLQTMLQHCSMIPGIPSSNTWEPMAAPELIQALTDDTTWDLHPYLVPLAVSDQKEYICALRNPSDELTMTTKADWPLVYTTTQQHGYQWLAQNAEQFMQRLVIAHETIQDSQTETLLSLYNDGATTVYTAGAAQQFPYGPDKYTLLKVGPFTDLYQAVAWSHWQDRQDEASALIAAETCQAKCSTPMGHHSLFYAQLLSQCPNRAEEARDAARTCLRLPLSTLVDTKLPFMETTPAWQDVVVDLGQLTPSSSNDSHAIVREWYFKIKQAESSQQQQDDDKTPQQRAVERANDILDLAVLDKTPYRQVREAVADCLREAELWDMADTIYPSNTAA
jgi:hypothetical protein